MPRNHLRSESNSMERPLVVSSENYGSTIIAIPNPTTDLTTVAPARFAVVQDLIGAIYEYLSDDLQALCNGRRVNRMFNETVNEIPEGMASVISSKLLNMLLNIPSYQQDIRFTKPYCTNPVIITTPMLETLIASFHGKNPSTIAQFFSTQQSNASESTKEAFELFKSLCGTIKTQLNTKELVLQSNFWKMFLLRAAVSLLTVAPLFGGITLFVGTLLLHDPSNDNSPNTNSSALNTTTAAPPNNPKAEFVELTLLILLAVIVLISTSFCMYLNDVMSKKFALARDCLRGDTRNEEGLAYKSFSPADARMFRWAANFFENPHHRTAITAADNTQQSVLTQPSARSE